MDWGAVIPPCMGAAGLAFVPASCFPEVMGISGGLNLIAWGLAREEGE